MDKKNLNYFKGKLDQQKKQIKNTIENMKKHESVASNQYQDSELSHYDNHPADLGTELFEVEHNRGLLNHQEELLTQIENASKMADNGTYGICKLCKKNIDLERLEILPYAEYCVSCKTEIEKNNASLGDKKPPEEEVIDAPFGRKYLNAQEDDENEGLDYLNDVLKSGSSDTPQDMGGYHDYNDFYTNDTDNQGVVDNTDKLSNQQYINQLPD